MNWVDLVIITILFFSVVTGIGKPLLLEFFDLFSFLLAFFLSLRFYNLAAKGFETFFSLPHSLANVIGFIVVWYISELVLFLISRAIRPIAKWLGHLPAEEVLSIVPSFLKGVVFTAIVLVLVATFPIQPKIKQDVQDSKIGSYILSQTYQLEAPLKNVFGGLANDTLTFLTVEPKTGESVDLGFKTDKFYFDEKMEFAMIDLVNKERVSRGLESLKYDPTLRQIARDHSADMFKRGYFSHYSPEGKDVADRAEKIGLSYLVIGENLAFAPNLATAHQGLMNSPGHRANILSQDYHFIGVGVANGGDFGVMFTQNFKN